MSIKTFALSAVVVAALGAPLANAATVVPAGYATGFVTAVNPTAGTIVVDGATTIKVTPSQLDDATLGTEVDVAYVQDGGLKALAVSPVEFGEDELVE